MHLWVHLECLVLYSSSTSQLMHVLRSLKRRMFPIINYTVVFTKLFWKPISQQFCCIHWGCSGPDLAIFQLIIQLLVLRPALTSSSCWLWGWTFFFQFAFGLTSDTHLCGNLLLHRALMLVLSLCFQVIPIRTTTNHHAQILKCIIFYGSPSSLFCSNL